MKTGTSLYHRDLPEILCLAIICIAIAGCGRKPADKGSPVVDPNKAVIEIINGGADECQVSIDGRNRVPVAPYKVLRFVVQPGRHLVKVFRGGQEEENMPVELKRGMAGVCNPGGRSDFVRLEFEYDEYGARKSRMLTGVRIKDEHMMVVDLGLLDRVPERYSMGNESEGKANLVKIYRVPSEKIGPDEAVAMLDGELQVHFGAGHSTARDFFLKAVEALHALPAAHVQRILSRILDEPIGVPWIDSQVVEVMFQCMADKGVMPGDSRLRDWVAADLKEPAFMARAIQSAKLLLEGPEADLIVRQIAGLPERNQASILIAARGVNKPELVRQVAIEGLKSASPVVEKEIWLLLTFGELTADEEVARHIESRLLSMRGDSAEVIKRRMSLERAWMSRLSHDCDSLTGDWVGVHLSRLLLHNDKTVAMSALRALLSRRESRRVADAYSSLSADMRSYALNSLLGVCREKKKASEEDVMLLGAALKDEVVSQRLTACEFAAELHRDYNAPGLLALMKQAKSAETDAEAMKKMDAFIQYAEAGKQ